MNLGDPKLTAYALGELTAQERQAIKEELEAAPEVSAYMAETMEFALVLSAAFHSDLIQLDIEGLSPSQRAEILPSEARPAEPVQQAAIPKPIPRRHIPWEAWVAITLFTLAAALLVIFYYQRPKAPEAPPESKKSSVALPTPTPIPEKKSGSTVRVSQTQSNWTLPQPDINIDNPRLAALSVPVATPGELASISKNTVEAKKPNVNNLKFQISGPPLGARTAKRPVRRGLTLSTAGKPKNADFTTLRLEQPSLAPSTSTEENEAAQPTPDKTPTAAKSTPRKEPAFSLSKAPILTTQSGLLAGNKAAAKSFLFNPQSKATQHPPSLRAWLDQLLGKARYGLAGSESAETSDSDNLLESPSKPVQRFVRLGQFGNFSKQTPQASTNLVFLIDVSASMAVPDKLPLVKRCMRYLVAQLRWDDRVTIITYAGAARVRMPGTVGNDTDKIIGVLNGLVAEGSTNGGQGIELAYNSAMAAFIPDGTNRVILITDGDFNVGVVDEEGLMALVDARAGSQIPLTVIGVGEGHRDDLLMEELAMRGGGNYAFIGSQEEGYEVLVNQLGGILWLGN